MRTYLNTTKSLLSRAILTLLFTISGLVTGNAQPVEEWTRRYNNHDKEDKAKAMKLDREGNIYVTGYTESKEGDRDFLTIKYSPNGNELWTAFYNGQENSNGKDDEGKALAVDNKGNVYVTGYTHSGARGRDYCTIKYNEKGQQVWISFFNGIGSIEDSDDEAVGIVYCESGFIYVTGNSDCNGTLMDFCTIQYNTSGDQLWAQSFNGQASGDDRVTAITLDNSDNIIITGRSEGIISGMDYLTIKYNMYGRELWKANYNGMGGNITLNDDNPAAIVVDQADNIYITGTSYGPDSGIDFLTVKYESEGDEIWVSRFEKDHPGISIVSDDEAEAIATDASGNIYVTGKTTLSTGGSDYLTVKINEKGYTEWHKVYNSELFDATGDGANALAIDRKGNVYVTGYINGEAGYTECGNERGIDFGTIKYSPQGKELWIKEFNGTGRIGDNDDIAKAIALDGKGKIFVMGESMGDETEIDYCVVGYSEFLPNDESNVNTAKVNYVLDDSFPNPFNPTTKIGFDIPVSSNVKLEIFDMSGRQVAMLVNKILQQGKYEYEWNATSFSSGTYFYKIQADGFVQTKKMLLIK